MVKFHVFFTIDKDSGLVETLILSLRQEIQIAKIKILKAEEAETFRPR